MAVERTVDINARPMYTITSPMVAVSYIVKPSNDGFCFYDISTSAGGLHTSLSGKYTSAEGAMKALEKHLNQMTRPSISVRRDEKVRKKEPDASTVEPKDQNNSQQGLTH